MKRLCLILTTTIATFLASYCAAEPIKTTILKDVTPIQAQVLLGINIVSAKAAGAKLTIPIYSPREIPWNYLAFYREIMKHPPNAFEEGYNYATNFGVSKQENCQSEIRAFTMGCEYYLKFDKPKVDAIPDVDTKSVDKH